MRGETWHREEGEKKEETLIYLKILTSGTAEGAKQQQRNSNAASSDICKSNAAITWPYEFVNFCRALGIWQLESCNLARVVILEHLLRKKLNLAQEKNEALPVIVPKSNWWCQKIHTGAFKALKSTDTSRKLMFVLFLTSLIISFSPKVTFSIKWTQSLNSLFLLPKLSSNLFSPLRPY